MSQLQVQEEVCCQLRKPICAPSKFAAVLRAFRSETIDCYQNRLKPDGGQEEISFQLIRKNGGVVALINDETVSLDNLLARVGWKLEAYA